LSRAIRAVRSSCGILSRPRSSARCLATALLAFQSSSIPTATSSRAEV
jgi:hypothetical protein